MAALAVAFSAAAMLLTVGVGSAAATVSNSDNSLTALPVSATAGQSTGTIVVGQWTDTDNSCPAAGLGDFTATINWGDGSPVDTGTLALTTGCNIDSGGTISGSHTYDCPGTYTVTVTFQDLDESSLTDTSTATVAEGQNDNCQGQNNSQGENK